MKNYFILTAILLLQATVSAEGLTYPKITGWQNTPTVEFINNKKATLKKNQDLKNAFVVVTANNEELTVQFPHAEKITVLEKSRSQVPQVSPDTGEAAEFFIFDGSIRFQTEKASKMHLKSAFFDLQMPAGIDVVITIDKKKPSALFQVIRGELKVAFLDFERTEILKAGEQITYEGENDESGNVKYDYFLDSKRMPHGVLKTKEKFDTTGFFDKEKALAQLRDAETAKLKKAELLKIQKAKSKIDSFLCKKPYGQKDQCLWKKADDKCFRSRCNVSGQWGDETERPMNEKCLANPIASPCDY